MTEEVKYDSKPDLDVRKGVMDNSKNAIRFTWRTQEVNLMPFMVTNTVGGTGKSFNESLSIKHDEQHLYLKPMGIWRMSGNRDEQLGFEGAAEY